MARRPRGVIAGMAVALAISGCGGAHKTTSYFTTQPGTVPSVNESLVAWQRHRVRAVARTYIRQHYACTASRPCPRSIKSIGTNSYEVRIRFPHRGPLWHDDCYRVRFFFKRHHFAGPMQPINCV